MQNPILESTDAGVYRSRLNLAVTTFEHAKDLQGHHYSFKPPPSDAADEAGEEETIRFKFVHAYPGIVQLCGCDEAGETCQLDPNFRRLEFDADYRTQEFRGPVFMFTKYSNARIEFLHDGVWHGIFNIRPVDQLELEFKVHFEQTMESLDDTRPLQRVALLPPTRPPTPGPSKHFF